MAISTEIDQNLRAALHNLFNTLCVAVGIDNTNVSPPYRGPFLVKADRPQLDVLLVKRQFVLHAWFDNYEGTAVLLDGIIRYFDPETLLGISSEDYSTLEVRVIRLLRP